MPDKLRKLRCYMAKIFDSEKRKKRLTAALCAALSVTLSLGVASACKSKTENKNEDEDTASMPTDTQVIKNGNFEFFSEMTKEEIDERRTFINSPANWTFYAGTPSSYTASGIVNADEWDYMTKSSFSLIRDGDRYVEDEDGNKTEAGKGTVKLSDAASAYAVENWDKASLYDRLEFYDFYGIDSESEFELYKDYAYTSIDFEDVKYLREEAGEKLSLYDDAKLSDADGAKQEPGVLMIHNHRTSDDVRGTAQYYTSGTTITLNAGTAAKVSVWVKTMSLYHFGATEDGKNDVPATKRAGAYIGVTNTVGGTTLDQMQIKNINTEGQVEENNGWAQYTVYIRANTFASTTFRIVLGLGQGSSDNRYEAVDGIALFDDVECSVITEAAYLAATEGVKGNTAAENKDPVVPKANICTLTSREADRIFSATQKNTGKLLADRNYALDLQASFERFDFNHYDDVEFGLTKQLSNNREYTSETIDPSLGDNRTTGGRRASVTGKYKLDSLKDAAKNNGFLDQIVKNDFGAKYPFAEDADIIVLLSTNKAAYSAILPTIEVNANTRMLVSFFVKTSEIRTGKSGASATLVDGDNEVQISAFDSHSAPTVDVDDDTKDIYDGWVQCFFFVENDSDDVKQFHLKLSYGPTAIEGSKASDYTDGYALFANFEIKEDLTKAQYSYASSGSYVQKTTLTDTVTGSDVFDSASASGNSLEDGLAIPTGYKGALSGSNILVSGGEKNPNLEQLASEYGIYTGLLSHEYAENYISGTEAWNKFLNEKAGSTDADVWWKNLFGNNKTAANPAYQPFVMLNTSAKDQPAYGIYATNKATVEANSSSTISVRVKVSANATAYLYLIDASKNPSEGYQRGLSTNLPAVTYWYDDKGNIVDRDPSSDDFDESSIVYTLEENGLYRRVGDESGEYFANLANYDRDEENNYVVKSGTPAFYYNPDDGKAYAYREGDEGNYKFSTPVSALPMNGDIVRYNVTDQPEAVIKVTGSEKNADRWITVNFFVQAGNADKEYRVELWAGARSDNASTAAKENVFPAGGYVFFDRCTTTSPDFHTFLDGVSDAMLSYRDAHNNYPFRAEDPANKGEQLRDKLSAQVARYYAFTFYDSPDYLRYDATKDDEGRGNPWRNYVQSEQEEELSYLYCEDLDGNILERGASINLFLNYEQNDVTVEAVYDEGNDTDNDDNDTDTDDSTNAEQNIWMYLASGVLVAAIVVAIVAVVFRKLWSKRKKHAGPKAKKPQKQRAPKPAKAPEKQEKPQAPEEPTDENDPYNE